MEADVGDRCCGCDSIWRWKERLVGDASKLFLLSNRDEEHEVRGVVVIDAATKRKNCNREKESGGDLGRRRQYFSPDFKLFVGNLPFSVDSVQLAELFETVGIVEVVEVIYHEMFERGRRLGFVTISSVKEVEAAIQEIHGYGIKSGSWGGRSRSIGHIDHAAKLMRVIKWNRSFRGIPKLDEGKDGVVDLEDHETHATVLDKLLTWEKKLYDEVKDGHHVGNHAIPP
ncbi:hypothetical protein PIB30_065133 [Stylosanthes scabra]|uniref:RRM domain-containing protein n=1 Tax=Stylosanthes scabra TaxID=79078 RepID=A0ABU6UNM8_9FABA|nr:hypothetical protein [Stylosanthes scabra]